MQLQGKGAAKILYPGRFHFLSKVNMRTRTLNWQFDSDPLFYLLLFVIVSIPIMYSLIIEKHLSADGAHYFAMILDEGNFTYNAWSREFANYVTQWPLVLAVKLEVKSIPFLINLYAVGIYFPYIVSFLLCLYAVRKENSLLLMFPILSIIGISFSGDYILVGEYHVMVLLSWPILFLLMRKEPLFWRDGWILWMLLFLFSRTYEAAIIPATIFSIILITRLFHARQSSRQLIIFGVSLFLSFSAMPIALFFILNPRDPSNKVGFISGMQKGLLSNEGALVTAIFTLFSTIGLISRKRVFLLLSCFLIFIYAYVLLINTHGPTALESFISRTLSLSLLPFLLMSAVVLHYSKIKSNKMSAGIFCVFVLIMALGNLHFSKDWNDFRKQVIDIVTTQKGYIPAEATIIKDNPCRWGWNNPEIGIAWSYPCVRAILLNSSNVKWEPFNPREKLILKNYISYDVLFSHVNDNITICQ